MSDGVDNTCNDIYYNYIYLKYHFLLVSVKKRVNSYETIPSFRRVFVLYNSKNCKQSSFNFTE